MFMFGLSSNLQAWDQGYSWFRLLFAVDSVRSLDLKCLKRLNCFERLFEKVVCGSSRYGRKYVDTLLLKTSID